METVSGYSAHADQHDLVNCVRRMRRPPSRIRLVHGERHAQQALREALLAWAAEEKHEMTVTLGAD